MKNLSFYLLVNLLLFFAFSCNKAKEKQQDALILQANALDRILDQHIDGGYYPFIYARLEDIDGNLLYEHSKVNETLVPNTAISGDTWFRIWSMSKIVTISIVLDLIEDGVLQFDDPVSKYIPEFENLRVAEAQDGTPLSGVEWGNTELACPMQLVPLDTVMTVAHLINHEAGFYYATTGIPCLDTLIANQKLPSASNTDDFLGKVAQLPLIQQPGNSYFYGINTTILGMVAERATGVSLKELLEERVTGPMRIEGLQYGLDDQTVLLPSFSGKDTVLRQAHQGELDIFGPIVPDYQPEHSLYLGGEGMVGTADGYADFIRMLLNGGVLNGHRFLNESTVKDIYAPHTQLDNPYGYNGYNLWISGDTMRVQGYGDAGLWIGGGYESTHFWADPKRKIVGVTMSQANFIQSPGYEMNDRFRGEIYQQIWAQENNNDVQQKTTND